MNPNLSEASYLLNAGLHLVKLKPYLKQPEGMNWNAPENRVRHIDPAATGYGIPLALNNACSIDPDNWSLAQRGMAALGFDLEKIMGAGVRTKSTRAGSGGRSAFCEEPDLSWIKFASSDPAIGVALELRAGSSNLQDVVPGLVYKDKSGALCTQTYCEGSRRWDDLSGLPEDLWDFWQRCSADLDYLHHAQITFMAAIGAPATRSITTGREGSKTARKLAYEAPGYRGRYNQQNTVESVLLRHDYWQDKKTLRWAPPTASGAPCVRPIPNKDGLWQSDHASDPLNGIFDAWVAHVQLDHGGDIEAAKEALGADFEPITDDVEPAPATTDGDDESDALEVEARLAPVIEDVAFYGPLKAIVEAATERSEATKVGVALHLLTSLAAQVARPFFVQLADEDAGLNIFTLQVGQSAIGRKGTSAALADRRLMPALREKLDALASEVEFKQEEFNSRMAEYERAKRHLAALEAKREIVQTATPEKLALLTAELDTLKATAEPELDKLQQRAQHYEVKLNSPAIAPKSLREYEKALDEINASISSINHEIQQAAKAIEVCQAALDGGSAMLEVLDQEISAARGGLSSPTSPDTPAWLATLAAQAGRPVELGGLSSGEGLINAIRDAREVRLPDGSIELEEGVDEKRMLVNLSEFGGVLTAMSRSGNSLSEKFRQAYDGTRMQSPSKGSPVEVVQHHVCMSGAITPEELGGLLFSGSDRAAQSDNGVGNRPIYAYVRRTKLVALPEPTGNVDEIVAVLWENIKTVYQTLNPDGVHHSVEYPLSDAAKALWTDQYEGLDGMRGSSANAGKLHGRLTTNGRKLAALLALVNGEPEVSAEAVAAALAWTRYSSATIDFIAANSKDRLAQKQLIDNAKKIWASAKKLMDENGGDIPKFSAIKKHCSLDRGKGKAAAMSALDWLQKQSPALIKIHTAKGLNAKKIVLVQPLGSFA